MTPVICAQGLSDDCDYTVNANRSVSLARIVQVPTRFAGYVCASEGPAGSSVATPDAERRVKSFFISLVLSENE